MAKPVSSITRWASDAVYTTGPAPLLGTATKISPPAALSDEGWAADFKPGAQHWNFLWEQQTEWLDWVTDGSVLADLDDHIVETDTSGDAAIARLVLGGTANGAGALLCSSNAAGAAATFTDTIGSFAIVASGTSGTATISGTNTGTGAAIRGIALGTDNDGGDFNGTGTGSGLTADGGSGGGIGALCTGGGSNVGVGGIGGSGGGAGGDFIGGDSTADGLIGRTTGAAGVGQSGVLGNVTGDAVGLRAEPTNGYGLYLDTPGNRGHMHLEGMAADPTTIASGDFWFNDGDDVLRGLFSGLKHVASFNRIGIENKLASITPTPAGSTGAGPATAVTQAVTPANPGNVLVTATAHVTFSADNAVCTVDIFDSVAAATVWSEEIKAKPISTAATRGETIYLTALVPVSAAARTFSLRFTSVTGTVTWARAVITIEALN